jgi:hypothetical protein
MRFRVICTMTGGHAMSLAEEVVDGTLRADGTLALDREPLLPAGRVRVTIRVAMPESAPAEDWLQYMQRTRRELEVAKTPMMTDDEARSHIDWLRSDNDGLKQIHREVEDGRRRSGRPGC